MPIEDVNAALRSNLDAESDPGQVVRRHKIVAMFANETRSLGYEHIGQDGVFVDVAHEQAIAILGGKCVGQIDTSAPMCGQMRVVPNRLDVVVNIGVHVRTALLVIDAPLHDVKQVWNHAARRESLSVIVEVKSPGIGQSASEDLKLLPSRMVTPDSTVDKLPRFVILSRFGDSRLREDSMASVEPTVGAPVKAIQSLVAIVDAPAIQQHLRWSVGFIVAICIGDEREIWW